MSKAQDVRKKRHLSLIVRVTVATVAIAWVLRGQDWGDLAAVFRRLNLGVFALALVVFAAAQVIIALRWWLLLRAQSIHIGIGAAIRLFFLGLFYNNVMPGAVGGDLLKAWYVTKHTDKRLEGALSVVVDRVVGLAGLILMAILTYSIFLEGGIAGRTGAEETRPAGWISQHKGVILWFGLAVVAALTLVLVHPHARARLKQVVRRALVRGAELLRGVRGALVVYCSKPWTLLWALLLTFVSQSVVIAAFWLLGGNLGIEAGPKYYFVIFPVMWVVAAVPISIAGLGVFEAGMVELFVLLTGAAAEEALAVAFCQRFVWVLASLPGGLIHLLGAHLPREISVDSREPLN